MKKILILLLVAAAATSTFSCGTRNIDLNASIETFNEGLNDIFNDSTTTKDEKNLIAKEYCISNYEKHRNDSLGLFIFTGICFYASPEEVYEIYENADDLIKENRANKRRIKTMKNQDSVAPGKPYKEITGIDAISGDTLALSSLLSADKPNVIDFWASWCVPCCECIKNHLLELAAKGEVNIVGIAVWEKSIENTQNAMKELGITWPVIYCEGRENSPTIEYGVIGIPELFLISPDGIIQANGNLPEDIGL